MLRTARLLLRPVTMEDVPALHAVFTSTEAMAYWSTPPHESLDITAAWVGCMLNAARTGESEDDFVLEYQGEVIGKAGFWRAPEVGFILHPKAWRKGLATEALSFLFERAFHIRRYPRVVADVDPRNVGCLALLGALGFRPYDYRKNTHQLGAESCDSTFLELTSQTWRARRPE
jgi:[ribosomal protein S5]-alanine N-acetyltransferase